MARGYLALGLLLLAAGCGQFDDPNRPATYPVTGTITHNGKPVEGAMVRFELADGSRSAIGKTDANGKYVLTTFSANDGALPGQYRVSILKYETPPRTPSSKSEAEYVPPEAAGLAQQATIPKNLLPAKYADVKTSGLAATVSESGENRFDFSLL